MAEYEQVAQVSVGGLIEDRDRAETVDQDAPLKEAAAKVRAIPSHVIVVTEADRVVGVLTQADITAAVSEGKTPNTKLKTLISGQPGPVTIDADAAIESVAGELGSVSTIIVTDKQGKARAAINRKVLADRIVNRFT